MFSRRTRARIEFIGYILSLVLRVFLWRRTSGENEEPPFAPQWLIGGGLYEFTYEWAYDRNLGAVRTNRWRRGLLSLVRFGVGRWVSPRSGIERYSFSTGRNIGGLAYRLWYGVLQPLPGIDE